MKNFIKNRTFIYIGIIGILIISCSCLTYAIFTTTISQEGTNNISTVSCINLTFSNTQNSIKLENTYPMTDERGMKNTPYTFTLTNNCKAPLTVSLGFEVNNSSTLSSSYVKTYFENSSTNFTNYLSKLSTMDSLNGGVAYKLLDDFFPVDGSKTYKLRLWLSEEVSESQASGKILSGKIIIKTTAKNTTSVNS
jgi:hypothetical protein